MFRWTLAVIHFPPSTGQKNIYKLIIKSVLPSCAQRPGNASPAPFDCWQQQHPEKGRRVEAEGAERWWSQEHKRTSEPLRSSLSIETDSKGEGKREEKKEAFSACSYPGLLLLLTQWKQYTVAVGGLVPRFRKVLMNGADSNIPTCTLGMMIETGHLPLPLWLKITTIYLITSSLANLICSLNEHFHIKTHFTKPWPWLLS